jgi:hypothetical protein
MCHPSFGAGTNDPPKRYIKWKFLMFIITGKEKAMGEGR